jgi:hypothetical protein
MSLHEQIESALGSATGRWRRVRLGGALALWAAGSAVVWLALGLLTWRGVVAHPVVFFGVAAALFLTTAAAFLVVVIGTLVTRPARGFLARQLERVHPSLLDRLNTLVWLEGRTAPPVPPAYARRIEWQARGTLAYEPPEPLFPSTAVWVRWLVALALLGATLAFYVKKQPWTQLAWGSAPLGETPSAEPNLKLPPPEEIAAEVKKAWGEVRITEPGQDLKVTKVDVVPLQIEAASSEGLKDPRYITAVGGGRSQPHALPAPAEPHYAVYKPLLYVDEFRLADWDVLTYYASAGTDAGRSYSSEVYFLEVRPFREDILKLPGGEGGTAYQYLNELSGLIDRQKHVIRETHGYMQRSYEGAAQKKQDRDALSGAEGDLADASRHLYAKIASKMENQDVGVVLDHLAQAERHLDGAARSLAAEDPKAQPQEHDGLNALVATRKSLQKAITDNPDAFKDGDESDEPMAKLEGKLDKISEFRNEEKTTQELLDRAVEQQKRLQQRAAKPDEAARRALGAEQEKLRREIAEFAADHPQMFKRAEKERAAADEAMRQSAESLGAASPECATAAGRATASLESLRGAVKRGAVGKDLEQAYELRDILEAQARELKRVEEDPSGAGGEGLDKTASEAKRASRELKRLMEETPAGDAFGDPLHDALGPARQVERERKLDALPKASGGDARRKAAEQARSGLEQLTRAFEESQPGVTQALRESDALKESDEDGFARALRQLEGLVAGAESGRAKAGDDARKQRREMVLRLRKGVEDRHGRDPKVAALLDEVEKETTKVDLKVDAQKLRKLMEQIERFRLEASGRPLAPGDDPRLKHVDPEKLPPAYRERIQRYFEKLAEEQ